MAIIEVNHQSLRTMAATIDDYCTLQKQQMQKLNNIVESCLMSDWVGEDATVYGAKWSTVDDPNSTTETFRKNLEAYADALQACAKEYAKAQAEIYNMSVVLTKW